MASITFYTSSPQTSQNEVCFYSIFWVNLKKKQFVFDSFTSPTYPKSTKSVKTRRRELTEEENDEIKEAFDLFDNDKDGELDYHEFKVESFLIMLFAI